MIVGMRLSVLLIALAWIVAAAHGEDSVRPPVEVALLGKPVNDAETAGLCPLSRISGEIAVSFNKHCKFIRSRISR